ncbi:hypothetical protein [Actinomycetospora chibensis]|uniref:DUF559 domain-containing protein n=1 Tax=Actinomycetospora chibensis TaxID=663606 RepID=A0ABV9RRV1_9PSEU|nr:hypothetical protein [Actinomycetospora chibensis]MDD7925270.1 hypothetical protein [Actinomycetospora chibensis]
MDVITRFTSTPFRASEAVAAGRITWDRLRGPDFVALARDVHVGAATEIGVRVRLEALDARSRGRGMVAGPLAALAWEVECPWDDAELVLPGHWNPVPAGVCGRSDRLRPEEIATRHGVAITTPVRTAFDLGRRAPLVEAVAAVDALAHACRFDATALDALAEHHPRTRGPVALRQVLTLVDPRAESLMKTRTRLLFVLRGVPAPIPQYRVRLPSGRYVRLDLAWPDVPPGRRKVAVEYDGPEHRTITGQNRDHFRDAALDDLGWEILHVPSAPVLDPVAADALAARVARKVLP